MKIFFTLLLSFLFISSPAQPGCDNIQRKLEGRVPGLNNADTSLARRTHHGENRIRIRCGSIIPRSERPLLVVDGMPRDLGELGTINPNNIESISILKEPYATTLFGQSARNGVIIVTLRATGIVLRDKRDSSLIAGAFVRSSDDKYYTTDDSGRVELKKNSILPGSKLKISSTGYIPLEYLPEPGQQTIYMDRDQKMLDRVVVTSGFLCRKSCKLICCRPVKAKTIQGPDERKTVPGFRTYPNLVSRGQSITIEVNGLSEHKGNVMIFNASGILVLTKSLENKPGLNRHEVQIPAQWPAGIYFVQFPDRLHHRKEQQKIILQ